METSVFNKCSGNLENGKNNVGKYTPHWLIEKISHNCLHINPKKNNGEPWNNNMSMVFNCMEIPNSRHEYNNNHVMRSLKHEFLEPLKLDSRREH